MPPPANPYNPGSYMDPNNLANLVSSGGLNGLGGLGSLAGGLLGAQGNKASASTSRDLPPFLQPAVAQDLIPRTQGLLNSQMPLAQSTGMQQIQKGTEYLSAPVQQNGYGTVGTNVAGNGYGQVQMEDPSKFMSPYYDAMAGDIGRRTADLLGQSNAAIRGNAVGVGGLGGSRQGVAEGVAAGKAADSLQGNLASLGGSMYQTALNGALQKFGLDTSFFGTQRAQDIAKAGQDQNFYGQQRGQDLTQSSIGSGLLSDGLNQQFAPLKNAAGIYSPFTGNGTSVTTQQTGGGAQGFVGGALGAAQLGKNLGLFGGGSSSGGVPPNPFATSSSWWG